MEWRYRHRVLALAVAANFGQFGARLALSPVVPFIILEFGLTKATTGFVLTAMWIAFALAHYPSGILADRYGERRVVIAALSVTTAASLLLVVAPTAAAFALVVVLLGVGAGLYFPVGTSLLTRLFEQRGTALGLHSSGAPISGLVVPVVMTAVAARYAWQLGFLFTAGVSGLTVLLFYALVRPTPPARPELRLREELEVARLRSLLARRSVATSIAIAIAGMFVLQAYFSFFPTFLQEHHGYDPGTASLLFGLVFVASAVSLPLQGRLSDRFHRDHVLVGAFATSAVGFAAVLVATRLAVVAISVVVIGLGLGWGGVIQSRIMDGFEDRDQGTGFGLVRTVFVIVGSAGSAVTGVLAEQFGWLVAYGLVVAVLVASAVLVLAGTWVSRRRR